jgi:hypothetical protein
LFNAGTAHPDPPTARRALCGGCLLTNAFSKKFEKHVHMVALYTVWYNFVRIHRIVKMTPAMAAGITDTLRGMEWITGPIEAAAPKPGPRVPYKKSV